LIVLFKFSRGIWGNIDMLFRDKFGKKEKIVRFGSISCPANQKGE
jgi:hypothetical protein